MKRPQKKLIPIEDQLAHLGGLWEKKGGFLVPRSWSDALLRYFGPAQALKAAPASKPKKPHPRPNCAKCLWCGERGVLQYCRANGGEDAYITHGSAFCRAVYKAA